ncbi:c-type cytochrome [Sphingobium nicotianae]|uniref:C-type cytochrome n=1 Tax=Sphingobium nicotianae TaxID=2782607 RepID=A0A9X1ITL1_9SPHN|nr:cytochrome c [Sphingobium nicotianae]MBT2189417.1 c-type cytochrome [Sphingobium nicotianae]
MFRRIVIGLALALVLGLGGFAAFAWRPSIAPIARPAASDFSADLVARGAVLASGGYCATCHTTRGGKPLAGGRAMVTAFGTLYSTNITPDPETGIGNWSEEAFRRAMHDGVARDGSHLFPAFPYDHFTKLSDADVHALYAWLMTRPAVAAPARSNALPFPLGIRALQAGWKLLFFKPGRFAPDPAHDAAWNRGAYLAEALGHCGACHTPRNGLGAEKRDAAYAGASIDNWVAPPLTGANPAPVPWTSDELAAYLGTGISRFHGTAAGPMAPVVHEGLAKLSPEDLKAVVRYVASLGGGDARAAEAAPVIAKALVADRSSLGPLADADARLYTAACASCHYNAGTQPNPLRPDLALNSAVSLSDPTNLIRVILYGISAKDGAPAIVMPGFSGFSDADVARICAHLRRTRTSLPPWSDLEKSVARIRAEGRGDY